MSISKSGNTITLNIEAVQIAFGAYNRDRGCNVRLMYDVEQ